MQNVITKAKAANTPVSYCGEQVSDILVAAALIGIGVSSLSVPATTVGPLRRVTRTLHFGNLGQWLDENLARSSDSLRGDLHAFLRDDGVPV